MKETIAVLLATYNGEKFLKQQLDSILSQTYQNFKIYISDDCSIDKTLEVIQTYKKQFPNKVFYTTNKTNIGYVKNFEKLLVNCSEDYIAFSDQDDIWENNKLEVLLKNLLSLESKNGSLPILVHSDLSMIDENSKLLSPSYFQYRHYKLKSEKDLGHILGPCGVMGNTLLINKKLKEIVLPFPKTLDVHDYWIAVNAELFGKRRTLSERLVKYRIHGYNTSNSKNKLQKQPIWHGSVNLPNHHTQRKLFLPALLKKIENKKDRQVLEAYLDYLTLNGNRLKIYVDLLKHSLVKRDLLFRMKLFFKLLYFKKLDISTYIYNLFQIVTTKNFKGWGRKKTGHFALWCYKKFGGTLTLQEDGFIRSLGLGVNGSPSFSLVEDDVGIYYDATVPSKLEKILNSYDFAGDVQLMEDAAKAIELIKQHHISKYNNAPDISADFFRDDNEQKVLVIAQTAGDASLQYGMLEPFTTEDMIRSAIEENPNAQVYIKIHPDVLSGKKASDIDPNVIGERCIIITENINPIALLKHFNKVYTKTSGMGFEALLVGCECVCFGMPFYAGWGVTDDRSKCDRRKRVLSVEEIFAAAYILYTRYYNPYTNKPSDIFDTIETIVKMKSMV